MSEKLPSDQGKDFVVPDESQRVKNPEVAEAMARAEHPYNEVAEKIISGKIHSDSPREEVLEKLRQGEMAGLIAGKMEELRDIQTRELSSLKLKIEENRRGMIADWNAGIRSDGIRKELNESLATREAIKRLLEERKES